MDIRARIGRNIKRLREGLKLSQEDLAEKARLHRTYVSGVERGVRNPTITVLEKFAKALDVNIGALTDP